MHYAFFFAVLVMVACGGPPAEAVKPLVIATGPSAAADAGAAPVEARFRETADEAFRKAAPALSALPPFVAPDVAESRLPNGARLLIVNRPGAAFFRIEVVARQDERDALPRAAKTAVADSIRGGTKTRVERQIGDDVDRALAQMAWWADETAIGVSLTARTSDPGSLIDLMSDLTLHATLPQKFVERDRDWCADQRAREDDYPRIVAQRVLPMAVHGLAAPRDLRNELRASDYRELEQESVLRAYDLTFVPARTTIIVVGDVSAASITPKLLRAFGTFPARPAHPAGSRPATTARASAGTTAPTAHASNATGGSNAAGGSNATGGSNAAGPSNTAVTSTTGAPRITFVDRPQSQQSYIMFGGPAPMRGSPDFMAAATLQDMIVNPAGRVIRRIRDERGLTWAAIVRLDTDGGHPIFSWAAETQVARTGEAVREIDQQMARYVTGAIDEAELGAAKERLARAFPGDLVTVDAISNALTPLAEFLLPRTELTTFLSRESAISASDVKRVASAMLDPARSRIVIVGDYAAVRPQLKGLGAIEIRDVNGLVLRVEK